MKAYYCAGTHWDREWYKPFQEFRAWLVELIDELLDLLESGPEYRCFHLDGQTVMLSDYLEIRPENKERLLKLLKTRRLLAGPWYNLPDEWLVSGEALVRNLLRGRADCRELGFRPMDFAYTPDQFGHIAALPMIMRGFGIRAGLCWRGTRDKTHPAQFVWVGPDGSQVAYHKLMDDGGYGPFDVKVRGPLNAAGFSDEAFAEHFEPYLKAEWGRSVQPDVLMLDAIDHQRPDPAAPELLQELQKRYPEVDFTWAALDEYGRALLTHAKEYVEYKGELREPSENPASRFQYLIVHTLSSRYDLKRRNDACQALLEYWAEPYTLFQRMHGAAPVPGFLNKAWEFLLQNHAHDSICGCSIDQVHRDMHYRFDQCGLIGDGIVRRACAQVAGASDGEAAWQNVVVHNPLPYTRTGVFELALPFPAAYREETKHVLLDGLDEGDRVNKFHLLDAQGARIAYQHLRVRRDGLFPWLDERGRSQERAADVHHVAAELELPPCGYTGFRVEATTEAMRHAETLMTGPFSAANEFFSVTLDANGSATLYPANARRSFDNLFLYEDEGECGDGSTHGKPVNDVLYRGHGGNVSVAIEEEGPLRVVFRVEREFRLPSGMDRQRNERLPERKTMRVCDFITLEKHLPCLRVHTVVDNTVRDHRLRVLFPTDCDTEVSFAETPFAVVERDIPIPPESATWHEPVHPEKPFTRFFGVADQHGGLAVLAPFGLHEYEVSETPKRSLCLTLFRSFYKTILTEGEEDGELQGPLEFDYLLYPFSRVFEPLEALRIVNQAQAGIRYHHANALPAAKSFLRFENGSALVTAIKPSADGTGGVIRLWNPTDEEVHERITLGVPLETAVACDLKEEPFARIDPTSDGEIDVRVSAHGLRTILFTWAAAKPEERPDTPSEE